MSSYWKYSGSFHTTNTTTNNSNLLRILSLLKSIMLRIHRYRINSATTHMNCIIEILIIACSFMLRQIKACSMTANTWSNIFFSSLLKFLNPCRISKELSTNNHSINIAILYSFGTSIWLHTSSTCNRYINKFLNMWYIIKITIKRHILWWMSPIPCIIGSIIAVKHIISSIL